MATEEILRQPGAVQQIDLAHRSGEATTFKTVAVIGAAGQTGELFTRSLAQSGIHVEAVVRKRRWVDEALYPNMGFHSSIKAMLERGPDAIIIATSNYDAPEAIKQIAEHAQKPMVLILPQNGVDVVLTAEAVLANVRDQFSLVRAGLFTTVGRDKEGNIVYNKNKKRIAIAPVDDFDSLRKTGEMLNKAGFEVRVVDNKSGGYPSMEAAKLLANLFGSTSLVTGLAPAESLRDRAIFALEHKALKGRLKILETADIKLADLWGIGELGLLARLPAPVATIFRSLFADQFAKERNNQPPAAAGQIKEGVRKVEPTRFYHKPMVKLGEERGLESPVDAAVWELLKRHERGDNFSLTELSAATRRKLLLEIVDLESRPVFLKKIALVTFFAEVIHGLFTKEFKVFGRENLQAPITNLAKGESVLFAFSHKSHTDHPSVVKALRMAMPQASKYPIYIVAGMLFKNELIPRIFGRAYAHLFVSTLRPTDDADARFRAHIINSRSAKAITGLLAKPSIVILYPEGTRSRTGQLGEAAPGASSWFLKPEFGLVVPGAINGSREMLPPGEIKLHRADLTVGFGPPIKVADLKAKADKTGRAGRDRYISQIVMAGIADVLQSI